MDRDLHIHSFFSPCAEPTMTMRAIVEAAAAMGMKDIGITDHPFHRGLAEHHQTLNQFRTDLQSPVRLWIGAELEVIGLGKLVLRPETLPLADYLIAAPSHYDLAKNPPVRNLQDPDEWAYRLLTDIE
ncbi:MAG: PHP domain-containing protein, partial [Kiritimatiellia bacterium]|nr:PHP domain-containing protein [Kiritimatiellia bacterium]